MWWRTAAQPPVGSGGGGAGSGYGGAQGGLPRRCVGSVPSSSSATADLAEGLPLPRINGASTPGRSSGPGEEVLRSGALLDSGSRAGSSPGDGSRVGAVSSGVSNNDDGRRRRVDGLSGPVDGLAGLIHSFIFIFIIYRDGQ